MDKKELFQHLNVCEDGFKELLKENGYKCNADGRKWMQQRVQVLKPRPLPDKMSANWTSTTQYTVDLNYVMWAAEEIGGLCPLNAFNYPNAQGEISQATVHSLYNIPEMPNPFLVCFSGYIGAPLYAMEIIRAYAKRYNQLLPFLAIGKGCNKGSFEKVYNRKEGIVIGSEYEAYLNIMEKMAPSDYVRRYQQVFNDMDTEGNLRELYRFAKEQELKEVSFILCTGQAWYDVRVLAEWMLLLKNPEFADIKVNLLLAHCPIWLNGNTPDTSVSEISLGYIAASLGPLVKDTITFDGITDSAKPERYLMPKVSICDWSIFEEVIRGYGNMGWPNYSELLYGTSHEEAVEEIILAHLFAQESFTAEDYDNGVLADIAQYQRKIGKFEGETELEFLRWCIDAPLRSFF